jgi:plasmid replication initiation protein
MSDLVVKDNALIRASYTLGLVEQRLILLAIIEARETGLGITPDTYLDVYASHYAKKFDVSVQSAYQSLSDAVETLYQRQVTLHKTYKGHPERQKVRWVSGISYVDSVAAVRIRFSPDVVPLITRLEERYTEYDLKQIAGLQSAYAVRLYELLIQWRNIEKIPVFELAYFRMQLGLNADEYTAMCDFKKRVLDLAVSQINKHTDIIIGYDSVKAGRVITGFTFTLKQKKPKTTAKIKSPAKPKPSTTETQLNWINSDVLERFNSLPKEQQKVIIDDVEVTLKGLNKARFQIARSSSNAGLIAEFAIEINEAIMRAAALM